MKKRTKLAVWADKNSIRCPTCVNIGCDRECAVRHWLQSGDPSIRTECTRCPPVRRRNETVPGVIFHKKTFCENIDGRLGFECPCNFKAYGWTPDDISCSLDMDHVSGSSVFDNRPENVVTLCKLCHAKKGRSQGDFNSSKRKRVTSELTM